MSKILLSIGILFKNDIRCLERCLQSLEPLRKAIPCQLVMADTGSTDGSRSVAERYADILIDFPWINDFAAARNAVLDRCTGKWYLTVDSDEWLDPEFSQLTEFLQSDSCDQYDVGSLIQRNYQDKKLRDYGDFFAMRLGRRCGGMLRYQGAIHEVLVFQDHEAKCNRVFPSVILHHDGYIDVDPKHIEEKKHRNMVLLREELEKKPHDIRLLNLCMDSAETTEEEQGYVERTEELLKQMQGDPQAFCMVAYQKCMQFYYNNHQMRRALECYDAWQACSPQSALLQMDGEGMAAIAAYDLNRYEAALEHIHNYFRFLEKKEKGDDLKLLDRLYAQYNTDNSRWRSNLKAIEFQSLFRLDRFEEADQVLRGIRLEDLRVVDRGGIVLEFLKQPECLTESAHFLNRCWDFYRDEMRWETDGENEEHVNAANDFIRMLLNYLARTGRDGWDLLMQMGERSPGCSARIVLSDDPGTVSKEWESITEWEWMFPEAYLHTMELRLPLPDGFYKQNSEQMVKLATALAQKPVFPRTVLDWLTHSVPPETPGQLTWQLNLVTAALRAWDWKGEVVVGEGLCTLYAGLSATYLDNIYNSELLNEEDIQILPGMQRYAWYIWRALEAWEQGDELGYVRSLKNGLDTAPAMKNMVDFLLEHKPKTAAQRQLEELAVQVRSILAQYTPDDPAVTALKQSPVYQKVEHLLVQQATSVAASQTLDDTPVSSTELEEALAGSREEIEASSQANLVRWGDQTAAQRTEYWEKYPLWGRDENQVVDNLSAVLSGHSQDFRWLFDRLGDEQSRRTLTAVVRSWRFFEVKSLEKVIDTTYDDYFDLSLLHCDGNEVVADLGAYTGDTFLSYIKNYGSMAYRRYYCYEITKNSFETLTKVTESYPRVVLRRKGAGAGPGTMTLGTGADASANTLSAGESGSAETVEIVALDDDIAEPLTLIKMDIEGAEQSALRGCARHIREDRPKLALSVYHNFEDLWKLPRMIEEMAPGYRFYLRYHGGNLWPSEITLLGIPD